jgi:hypothetical protein
LSGIAKNGLWEKKIAGQRAQRACSKREGIDTGSMQESNAEENLVKQR